MSQRPLVGIGVIIRKDNQILLMKRQNSHGDGTWSVPGGHLEYSETPQECAIREAMEETGVSIANPTFLAITNDIFAYEHKHYVTIWLECTYVSGEPTINSQREMSEVGWFPWTSLPEPLFLPMKNLLVGNCMPSTLPFL